MCKNTQVFRHLGNQMPGNVQAPGGTQSSCSSARVFYVPSLENKSELHLKLRCRILMFAMIHFRTRHAFLVGCITAEGKQGQGEEEEEMAGKTSLVPSGENGVLPLEKTQAEHLQTMLTRRREPHTVMASSAHSGGRTIYNSILFSQSADKCQVELDGLW